MYREVLEVRQTGKGGRGARLESTKAGFKTIQLSRIINLEEILPSGVQHGFDLELPRQVDKIKRNRMQSKLNDFQMH